MGSARSKLTAAQNAASTDLTNRTVLITGANSGIGLETSRVLASRGARVLMAARSPTKNAAAIQALQADPTTTATGGSLIPLELDLTSFASIRRFADAVIAAGYPIHLLILNAGIMAVPLGETADGIEMHLGVNYVGHFYLTQLLMPLLQRTATPATPVRIITLSSLAHRMHPYIDYAHLPMPSRGVYDKWKWYGQSKWACLLHAAELNHRYAASNITAYSVHPGIIHTGLYQSSGYQGYTFRMIMAPWSKDVPQGAASTVYAAVSPDVLANGGGKYIVDSQVQADVGRKQIEAGEAAKLWDWTEQLIRSKTPTSSA